MANNTIHVLANLTRDPELREINGGTQVCALGLAANVRIGKEEVPVYYQASVFGKHGEACAKNLTKGDKVYVVGEFFPQTYSDKNGAERVSNQIRSANVEFVITKGGQGGNRNAQRNARKENPQEGDLPF